MNYLNFDPCKEVLHHFDIRCINSFEPAVAKLLLTVEAPSFSIPKLSKIRTKIYNCLIDALDMFDDTITPDTLKQMSTVICRAIKYPVNKYKTVYDTLRPLIQSQEITSHLLYVVATKISGNIDLVEQNQVIPRWEDIDVPVWVPVEIVGQQEVYGTYPGKEIKAFITGGMPAGMTLIQKVSNKFIQCMLREIGYPRYKKFDARDIYNTRFTCNILKKKGVTKMVAFSVSNSQSKHNKALYKIRHDKCPYVYNIECINCLNGLKECQGALHRELYFVGDCIKGHRGIMKPGNKKCNICIEQAKLETARALFEKRRNRNEQEK